MKKLLGIVVLGLFLSGCATPISNEAQQAHIKSEIIKIEHPMGTIDCAIVLNTNFKKNLVTKKDLIISCGIYRTSRILMKGQVYF